MQSYYRSHDVFHKNPQKDSTIADSIGQYRTVKIDQSHRSRLQNFIERNRSATKRDSQDNYSSFFKSRITELDSDCETSTEVIVSSLKELDSKLKIKRDKSIDTKDEEISFSIDGKHFDSSNSHGSPPSRSSRTPDPKYRTPTKNIKRNTTFSILPQESNSYSQIMTVRKYSDKIKSLDNLSKQLEKRKKEIDTQEAVIMQKLEELKWREAEMRDRILAPERLREIERMLRYEELEIKGRLEAVIAREAMVEERERKLQEIEETDNIRRKLIFDTTILKTPAFSLENSLSVPLQGTHTEESLSKLEAKLRSTTIDLEARTCELIEKEKAAEMRVRYIQQKYLDEYEESLNNKFDYILSKEENLAKHEETIKKQKAELTKQICRNIANEVVLLSLQDISAKEKERQKFPHLETRIDSIMEKCASFEGVNAKLVQVIII